MKKHIPNIILIVAVVIFIWLTIDVILQTGQGDHINFTIGRNYGGLLGGIFSFLSIVLIYYTLNHQTNSYNRSSFENKFFELIKYHRENVSEWEHINPDSEHKEIVKGQKIFVLIHRQILKALSELDSFFKGIKLEDFILPESICVLKENKIFIERNIDLILLQKINIAYMVVFFGVGQIGYRILHKSFGKKYKLEFFEKVLEHFQKFPAMWDNDINRIQDNFHFKYFGGHQNRLGHYMRHFYQTINYVNSYTPFKNNYLEKYNYVKTYRAQLSTYEQSVFFFNSISDLGNVWELETMLEDYNNQLITKYNLIKNIPVEFTLDIDLSDFYPDVEYERGEKTIHKRQIEKKYK